MDNSRRNFLKAGAAATLSSAALAKPDALDNPSRQKEMLKAFAALPGDVGLKVYAPPASGRPGLSIQSGSNRLLFVASAIKGFVLGEALRQADSPEILRDLGEKQLALDDTVWSPGSPIFNPPDLTGIVSERTALEAMITRSDNTATDMAFKLVGAANVRKFIASAGLKSTLVPDSTRAFAAYLFGAKNYRTITWAELLKLAQGKPVRPFLNNVQTLASSADDLVSYYSRALPGEFFHHPETLQEFRRILTLCDYIYLIPLPLGVSAYAKSGNADSAGFHARSVAGGLFFADRWLYFSFLINWYSLEPEDPTTVASYFSAINQTLTLAKDLLSA